MIGTLILEEIEAKAKAATLGPWANCDTVDDQFNADPIDWWLVYAGNDEPGFPVKTICRATGYATEEEEKEARAYHKQTDKMKDPGQGGSNAAYIAAVDPGTVRLLIGTIRTLGRYLEEEGMPQEVECGGTLTVASLQASDWINKAFAETQEDMEAAK